tara:strand:+ start:115 stop:759 length:645 start_codon:yes stop_codon:yes gene_type:complete
MTTGLKVYNSRSVILNLIKKRGFITDAYENYSEKELTTLLDINKKEKHVSSLDIVCNNKEGNKILVKYLFIPKIRYNNLTTIVDSLIEEHLSENDTLILILSDKINNEIQIDTYFNSIYKEMKIYCQFFWIDMVTYDVTEHHYVPKHELMTQDEVQKLKNNINISNLDQLPIIYSNDPVAKYLGLKLNDICKITRPSETSGEYVNYRICKLSNS